MVIGRGHASLLRFSAKNDEALFYSSYPTKGTCYEECMKLTPTFALSIYQGILMKTIHVLPILIVTAVLSACTQASSPPESPDSPAGHNVNNGQLCEVNNWRPADVASQCEPGQKVVFLPNTFGNEQLPVIFTAANCDLRYTVALTNGGVTCIYGPITLQKTGQDTQSDDSQDSH